MTVYDTHSDNGVVENYFLKPGYIFLPETPHMISAVLGSGVSVSIYDKKHHRGGMGLFLYPFTAEKDKATALYGNVATLILVRMMLHSGSKKKHLQAQIFGGGFCREISKEDIGRRNIDTARRVLARNAIPVISEDVGGEKGRKLIFNTTTNTVAVLKVDSIRSADWYPYENNR